jgi:hypothetical protein
MRKGFRIVLTAFLFMLVFLGSALFLFQSKAVHAVPRGVETAPALYPDNANERFFYNQDFQFDGVNFTPNSQVTLQWSGTPVGTYTTGKVIADSSGSFIFYTEHALSVPFGTQATLTATDANGLTASTSLGGSPSVASIPSSGAGRIGQTIEITGGGFASGEIVTITWPQPQEVVATTTADADGKFLASFKIPAGSPVGFAYVTVQGAVSGYNLNVYCFTTPKLSFSPSSGPGGTTLVMLKGEQYTPNSQVQVNWYDPQQQVNFFITTAETSATGAFTASFYVPADLVSGVKYQVQVEDSRGAVNSVTFTAK